VVDCCSFLSILLFFEIQCIRVHQE
jgi:hypothetical protein